VDAVLSRCLLPEDERMYVARARQRIEYTLNWLARRGVAGCRVLEIGLGAIGVGCRLLGAVVEAWDKRSLWDRSATELGITVQHVDLRTPATYPAVEARYDYVILAEVIEHIALSPFCVLEGVKGTLKPGGCLVLTTPNLVRLSNRLRMALGRPLFAPFYESDLVMGHVREYTLPEVRHFIEGVGLSVVELRLANWDIPGHVARLIGELAGLWPTLRNTIWAVAVPRRSMPR